ncbi:MAG: hypothetical protein CL609_11105 [Anaerolineaceae bacterium]|nr:hypothetical protein [Anaerolineaceae bacterium]
MNNISFKPILRVFSMDYFYVLLVKLYKTGFLAYNITHKYKNGGNWQQELIYFLSDRKAHGPVG